MSVCSQERCIAAVSQSYPYRDASGCGQPTGVAAGCQAAMIAWQAQLGAATPSDEHTVAWSTRVVHAGVQTGHMCLLWLAGVQAAHRRPARRACIGAKTRRGSSAACAGRPGAAAGSSAPPAAPRASSPPLAAAPSPGSAASTRARRLRSRSACGAAGTWTCMRARLTYTSPWMSSGEQRGCARICVV